MPPKTVENFVQGGKSKGVPLFQKGKDEIQEVVKEIHGVKEEHQQDKKERTDEKTREEMLESALSYLTTLVTVAALMLGSTLAGTVMSIEFTGEKYFHASLMTHLFFWAARANTCGVIGLIFSMQLCRQTRSYRLHLWEKGDHVLHSRNGGARHLANQLLNPTPLGQVGIRGESTYGAKFVDENFNLQALESCPWPKLGRAQMDRRSSHASNV